VDHRRLRKLGLDDVRPRAAPGVPEVSWPVGAESGAPVGPGELYRRYPPAVAGEAVSRLRELREVEPAMTADVLAALPDGTEARGLASRVKSPGSLARKIANRSELKALPPHEVADGLTDVVRYTVASPDPGRLVADTQTTVAALTERGWSVVEVQHTYASGNPYKGLHLLVRHPNGWTCELQAHSEESLEVKGTIHGDYEVERDLARPISERAAAHRRMVARSAELAEPAGLAELETLGGCPVETRELPDRYTTKQQRDADDASGGDDAS
jgi:hypothetical protein